ncbi:MAG: leucyl/phenylalanyl-tRNA--protein transferase [Herpetosiphonaceae bacterium]|nr:MAG: leucyl/phenylalanyl-tRNA--protein transferase [Herpetosiphonaceae bacterium]
MNTSVDDSMAAMLNPQILLAAYSQGIFPMADEQGLISWYDPDPRAILPLETFHVPRRLARTVRNGPYEVRIDSAFRQVMEACAAPAPGREQTWITPEMIDTYTALHDLGFAHSVETWLGEELVGGLYGVAIRGLFAGESMFSRRTDASKVALVHLVERLRRGGFMLLDTQFLTGHLARFGAVEIPRHVYKALLARALQVYAVWDP